MLFAESNTAMPYSEIADRSSFPQIPKMPQTDAQLFRCFAGITLTGSPEILESLSKSTLFGEGDVRPCEGEFLSSGCFSECCESFSGFIGQLSSLHGLL